MFYTGGESYFNCTQTYGYVCYTPSKWVQIIIQLIILAGVEDTSLDRLSLANF